jgi:hypothetical protein
LNIEQLLVELAERQVTLFVKEDRLRFRAPQGALTAELRAAVAEHREGILDRLRPNRSSSLPPRCLVCRRRDWVDQPPKDGLIRTTCGRCGRFIGYRPATGENPPAARLQSG